MEIYGLISVLYGVIPLMIIGGILYGLFRKKDEVSQHNGPNDIYFYAVCFVALMVLFWAGADLLRVLLSKIMGVDRTAVYYSSQNNSVYENFVRSLSLRLSVLLVATPIYVFHWFKASHKPRELIDWKNRKAYAMGIMLLSTLLVLGFGSALLYQTFNMILGVAEDIPEMLSVLVPYGFASVGCWVWHLRIWLGEKSQEKIEETPKM